MEPDALPYAPPETTTYDRETRSLRIDLLGSAYASSLEDEPTVMGMVIDGLRRSPNARRVVLIQDREYEYEPEQTAMLTQIAQVLNWVSREKLITPSKVAPPGCEEHIPKRIAFLQNFYTIQIRQDPIGAYVAIKRYIEELEVIVGRATTRERKCYVPYIQTVLNRVRDLLHDTELLRRVKDKLPGHHIGSRDIYRQVFFPTIRPNFMLTRYSTSIPTGGKEVERYDIQSINAEVHIYKVPGDVRLRYHISPPEFNLGETEYSILDTARRYMSEHEPTEAEFSNPERTREIFFNIGRDMIMDIAATQSVDLSAKTVDQLAAILTRYTAGFGVLELLLADPNLQDIYANSPIGQLPIYVLHGKHGECQSNLIPTHDDAESWATRFRMKSGRPLDEANPVLDTDLSVPGGRARVAIITKNLSPDGLAYSFRRHRSKPWTFPLFIKSRHMNSMAAGLMSFLIDGARTCLIAGTRSAGKTSILSACLVELMKRYRIVTVEDTMELPIAALRQLGYNIESMKSRSVITRVESELPADEAIRTALRLGDSVLVLGEVRSKEAQSLYEAMRIGALANFVGGTIHGDSAYGVFDRVVNDLGVPPTSFKATDIIVLTNTLKSADGLHTFRRVLAITEVQKEWKDDPLAEKAFTNLMEYDAKTDQLLPTSTLLNGESVILTSIASRVREWKNNWDAIWGNIQLRTNIKQHIVDISDQFKKPELLEASFVVACNEKFHELSDEVRQEYGDLDPKRIYERWAAWADAKAEFWDVQEEEE